MPDYDQDPLKLIPESMRASLELSEPAVRLDQGLSNHVWRMRAGAGTAVVKRYPPSFATLPDIALDPSRATFEVRALDLLSEWGWAEPVPGEPIARVPRVYGFDAEASILVMEDLGTDVDLATWLTTASVADAHVLGQRLGHFIGRLHTTSANQRALAERFDNAPVQQTRRRVQYHGVHHWLRMAMAVLPEAEVDELASRCETLGNLLLERGHCLIMGDLALHSLLVGSGTGSHRDLYVVDWEFAHWGQPLQDTAHLAAHLWMLGHRRPTLSPTVRSTWQGFASGYVSGGGAPNAVGCNPWAPVGLRAGRFDPRVHVAAEILARSVGPFREGSLYDGLDGDADAIRQAVRHALALGAH